MGKYKIGVIGGGGHIGLVHAACLASLGYDTAAYDIQPFKINSLKKGVLPFYEPGLKELVLSGLAENRLSFTGRLLKLREADLVYICVGTPALPDNGADTGQVESVIKDLAQLVSKPAVAIMKSTVPVGTARRLTRWLSEQGLSCKLTIVSNPEFLAEGSGVADFMKPSRIVVGAEDAVVAEKVAAVHAPTGVPVVLTSWENAELIKYASNAFLAARVSLINEIASLSESVDGDIRIVSKGVGLDPRIGSQFLEAGVGFSGPCLEKDLRSLISQFGQAGEDTPLLETVLYVNEQQRLKIVKKLEEQLGSLAEKEIAVLGLAFKPGTDELRDSHSIPIIEHLLSLGAAVTVHDPLVGISRQKERFRERFPDIAWAASPYEAAKGKDALLILTAWPEYKELDPEKLKGYMAVPVIVDGRNLFEPAKMNTPKIKYRGVGVEVGSQPYLPNKKR